MGAGAMVCFAHFCIPGTQFKDDTQAGKERCLLRGDMNPGAQVNIPVRCSWWFKQNGGLALLLEGGHPGLVEQRHELFGDPQLLHHSCAIIIMWVSPHGPRWTAHAPAITSTFRPLELNTPLN